MSAGQKDESVLYCDHSSVVIFSMNKPVGQTKEREKEVTKGGEEDEEDKRDEIKPKDKKKKKQDTTDDDKTRQKRKKGETSI